jgi:hypothetical protein
MSKRWFRKQAYAAMRPREDDPPWWERALAGAVLLFLIYVFFG